MTGRLRLLLAALALAFLAAHLRDLPRTLEDIDSINFALGVESFDVADHRPHPPGYPVFIGLARVSNAALKTVAPSWDRDRRAAVALAIWNVIFGALAAFVIAAFWMAIGLPATLAVFSTVLALCAPLFWFTASRPLSDTAGLVAALAVQALVARGLQRWPRGSTDQPVNRSTVDWIWAAFAAGLIIGLRSQTLWLTAPLLMYACAQLLRAGRAGDAVKMVGAAAIGALLWAIPLVVDSGGVSAYMAALGSQGAEDFSGVRMLWTQPSLRLLKDALSLTFLAPWQALVLGQVVTALAVIGCIRLARRDRPALVIVLLAFAPYVVFHLLFHETVTVRYALPAVVPMAGLAVVAVSSLGIAVTAIATAALAVISLAIVQPRLHEYATQGAPIFRAFQAMQQQLPQQGEKPVLAMHHQVWWGVRRVLDWYRPSWDTGAQPHPGDREWLTVVDRFLKGQTAPVWLLADLSRSDVAAFDPRSRRVTAFNASPMTREMVGGARLDSLAWWVIEQPRWMLGRGWSLTTEMAGVTKADDKAKGPGDAVAYVRRDSQPLHMMIGGRYLGGTGTAEIVVSFEGKEIDRWTQTANPNWFVRHVALPGVVGAYAPYATLTVRVTASQPGAAVPDIGLEQFDVAAFTDPIMAFADGWHEFEGDPATGETWRWTSKSSTLLIWPGDRDVQLSFSGESPAKSFDRAPEVVVRAGDREVTRFKPSSDYSKTVVFNRADLAEAKGRVTIETDLVFVPGDRNNSPDRRQLGLKLFSVEIR